MGLARVHKPEGLVSHKAQSKTRLKTAIEKRDLKVRFESAIQIGVTHKCDQQVRLTSVINRCNSQVRSNKS